MATFNAGITDVSPIRADGVWENAWTVGVIGALAAYLVGLLLLSRGAARTAAVVGIALVIQLAPLATPLLLSKDVYAYWGFGRVGAVQDANPYERAPADYPDDPATSHVGADWVDTTPVYGPAFTGLSEVHAAAVGDSPDTATRVYRILAALAVVGIVLLTALVAPRPAFATAFVGWNPLLALHFAGGGHNDALMMLPAVGAIALAARHRDRLAGATWALAVMVKWMPLALLFLLGLALRGKRRWRLLGGFALGMILLSIAATIRYGTAWPNAFGAGGDDAYWTSSISVQYWLEQLGLPRKAAFALPAVAFLAVYAWLAWQAWRGGRARLSVAAAAVLLSSSWLVPWYALWAIPLAAIEDDRLGKGLALGLTVYFLWDAVPL
jgi:hypothetical protein